MARLITARSSISLSDILIEEGIQANLYFHKNESVDLIAFLFNIEANKKNYHRHIVDIPRIIFLV